MRLVAFLLFAASTLLGCATPHVSVSGPVTILETPDIEGACGALGIYHTPWTTLLGCVAIRDKLVTIVCPRAAMHCVAHEVHHVLDPEWAHDPDPAVIAIP